MRLAAMQLYNKSPALNRLLLNAMPSAFHYFQICLRMTIAFLRVHCRILLNVLVNIRRFPTGVQKNYLIWFFFR